MIAPSGSGSAPSRKALIAISFPRTARKSLLLPASWATEINFQSRNPGGILIPKMGAASSSAVLAAYARNAMAQTAVAAITRVDVRFIEQSFRISKPFRKAMEAVAVSNHTRGNQTKQLD